MNNFALIQTSKDKNGKTKGLSVDNTWLRKDQLGYFVMDEKQIDRIRIGDLPTDVNLSIRSGEFVHAIFPRGNGAASVAALYCTCHHCMENWTMSAKKLTLAAKVIIDKNLKSYLEGAAIPGHTREGVLRGLGMALNVQGETCGDVIREANALLQPIQDRLRLIDNMVVQLIDSEINK